MKVLWGPLVHFKTIRKLHKNREFCCQWSWQLYPRTTKSSKMSKSRLVTLNGKDTESPWFHICYYICLHGLSSWNTTVLHQTTEICDLAVLRPAGTGRALFLTCMWSSSGCVFPWPFFWVQEEREIVPLVSLLSQGHQRECLPTVEILELMNKWALLNWLHTVTLQRSRKDRESFSSALLAGTPWSVTQHHTVRLQSWLLVVRPQPYDSCCVLAVEYLPKTHIWKGVLSRSVVLGKPRNPGLVGHLPSWPWRLLWNTSLFLAWDTVIMIGATCIRAPWATCSWARSSSIVTYINLFLLGKYVVSGISL